MNKKVELTKIIYTCTCTDLTQNKIYYSPFLIDLIPVQFFIRDIFCYFRCNVVEPLLPPAGHNNIVVDFVLVLFHVHHSRIWSSNGWGNKKMSDRGRAIWEIPCQSPACKRLTVRRVSPHKMLQVFPSAAWQRSRQQTNHQPAYVHNINTNIMQIIGKTLKIENASWWGERQMCHQNSSR